MDGRKISHEVLEYMRFRSTELRESGEKVNDIARFFGVKRGSVSRWLTKYKRGGKNLSRAEKSHDPNQN